MLRKLALLTSNCLCKRSSKVSFIDTIFFNISNRNVQLDSVKFRYTKKDKTFYRFKKSEDTVKQIYDAFLILDFESTCMEGFGTLKEQEIIEFPCLWLDGKTFQVTSQFHQFVKPKICEQLDPFCVTLTGINDDTLANQPYFETVLKDFLDWFEQQKTVNNAEKTVFVTSGDWDLKVMLPMQCQNSDIPVPTQMTKWINIKESFSISTGTYPYGLKHMLEILELPFEGRLHSGIDDCKNIANIVKKLAEGGLVLGAT
uniref:Eri-1-1 n=1 Tax=Nilaparvata lugens TaxID=108931 RepID=M4QKW8_NILLU|nr:Eri-1-1 [Nilaparvata lugens]